MKAIQTGAVHFVGEPCEPGAMVGAVAEACSAQEAKQPIMAARARIARLMPREPDVFGGPVAGHQNKVIAYGLGISPRPVEMYRATLMGKLRVESLSAVVYLAFIAGLVAEAESEAFALAA